MIPDSFKQEVLARVDIVDLIDARVPLKKAGANYSACCPFHTEKTPSFTVSPTKQFYHCFGCGAHGNAISFLIEYGGLGYIDALRELAESVGMKLPELDPSARGATRADAPDLFELMLRAQEFYKEELKRTPRAIEYLKGRGLTGKVAARFGVGYAPDDWQGLKRAFPEYDAKVLVDCGLVIVNDEGRRYDRFRDRIMFPIQNQRGQVIGFGGRVIAAGDGPKYMNSPETTLFEKGRELYGLPQARQAIRTRARVFVVEGYMDVVALAQFGVENAVATLGTATTSTHVVKLLRQTNEIVFCFDGDAAGRKAAWHALEVSLAVIPDGKLVRFLFLPPEHDPDSYVREYGADAFSLAADRAPPLSAYLQDELARRNPLDTAEGRSKLVNDARPLLAQMAAPILQAQLLRELAAAAQLPAEELARLVRLPGARTSAASRLPPDPGFPAEPAVRSREQRDRGGFAAPDRRGGTPMPGFRDARRALPGRVALALSGRIEQRILEAVLAHPELASEIPIEFLEPAEEPRPVLAALAAVVDHLSHAGPVADPPATGEAASGVADSRGAAIVEQFRGSPHEDVLAAAQAAIISVEPTPEDFRGGLAQLAIERLSREASSLNEKAKAGPLSTAEMARFRFLQTEMHRLRSQRGSGSIVL